jgi:hypothetical protein
MAKTGGYRPGAGRPKGTQNKDTALAREAIARFVDNNTERLQEWLDQIAIESPEKAFNCVRDLLEYHVPKLNRTEHTGKDGGKITLNLKVDAVPNAND